MSETYHFNTIILKSERLPPGEERKTKERGKKEEGNSRRPIETYLKRV